MTAAVEQPLITVTHQTDPRHRVQVSFNGTWLQRDMCDKAWHSESDRACWAIAATVNDGLVAYRYTSRDGKNPADPTAGTVGDYLRRFADIDQMVAAIVPEGYPDGLVDGLRKNVMWLRVEHRDDW
jgi:hypothetical protein